MQNAYKYVTFLEFKYFLERTHCSTCISLTLNNANFINHCIRTILLRLE